MYQCGKAHHWLLESDKAVPLPSDLAERFPSSMGRVARCKRCYVETVLAEKVLGDSHELR